MVPPSRFSLMRKSCIKSVAEGSRARRTRSLIGQTVSPSRKKKYTQSMTFEANRWRRRQLLHRSTRGTRHLRRRRRRRRRRWAADGGRGAAAGRWPVSRPPGRQLRPTHRPMLIILSRGPRRANIHHRGHRLRRRRGSPPPVSGSGSPRERKKENKNLRFLIIQEWASPRRTPKTIKRREAGTSVRSHSALNRYIGEISKRGEKRRKKWKQMNK